MFGLFKVTGADTNTAPGVETRTGSPFGRRGEPFKV